MRYELQSPTLRGRWSAEFRAWHFQNPGKDTFGSASSTWSAAVQTVLQKQNTATS